MILILGGLLTWRVAHMISREAGPLDIFAKLRANLASRQKRSGGLYDMVSCVSCTGVYVGAVTALGAAGGVLEWVVYTLAFSAIATILERVYSYLKS